MQKISLLLLPFLLFGSCTVSQQEESPETEIPLTIEYRNIVVADSLNDAEKRLYQRVKEYNAILSGADTIPQDVFTHYIKQYLVPYGPTDELAEFYYNDWNRALTTGNLYDSWICSIKIDKDGESAKISTSDWLKNSEEELFIWTNVSSWKYYENEWYRDTLISSLYRNGKLVHE